MDGIRKATDNTYKMYNFFYNSIDLVRYFVSIGISSYVVFRLSPTLGLFLTVSSIPGILIMVNFVNRIWHFVNSTFEKRRKSWWLSNRLRRPKNREESTVTKSNIYIYNQVKKLWNLLGIGELRIIKRRFLMDVIDNAIVLSQTVITFTYLLFQMVLNTITLGKFTFYFGRTHDFNNDLFNLSSRISNLWDSGSYIQFIRDVFEIEPAIISGTKSIKTKEPPEIEVKNVWFKYPNTKKYILKNINLTIKPGNEIAIVGENGAGKTTLIKLLLRFYDPTKGEISVNGIPLKEIDLNYYYSTVGALFQEFERFKELTVEENIKMGNINSSKGFKAVEEAAKMADCDTFINKLDKKYKQILDRSFTGGIKLSTGQWQKIALARMFYRNAPVLILDEPTASIDANAEFRIFNRIFKAFKGKTLIIISHRFSTVRHAQKIYVIHEGEIVEEGSHEQLMKEKGRYQKAFNLQAMGYKK
jgi:ABC-type multidrug transport system fused ATPase/permease subunit